MIFYERARPARMWKFLSLFLYKSSALIVFSQFLLVGLLLISKCYLFLLNKVQGYEKFYQLISFEKVVGYMNNDSSDFSLKKL